MKRSSVSVGAGTLEPSPSAQGVGVIGQESLGANLSRTRSPRSESTDPQDTATAVATKKETP